MQYICANNYFTAKRFDEVIAKIKWCSFLPHSVHAMQKLNMVGEKESQYSQPLVGQSLPNLGKCMLAFVVYKLLLLVNHSFHSEDIRPCVLSQNYSEIGRFEVHVSNDRRHFSKLARF